MRLNYEAAFFINFCLLGYLIQNESENIAVLINFERKNMFYKSYEYIG